MVCQLHHKTLPFLSSHDCWKRDGAEQLLGDITHDSADADKYDSTNNNFLKKQEMQAELHLQPRVIAQYRE